MRVILLMGPSSVGKSTLCEELVKTQGWKAASLDEAGLLMDSKSDLIKLKPELQQQVETSGLLSLMSEKDILNLCIRGKLTISKGQHLLSDHQFNGPQLTGLEEVLKSAGFDQSQSDTLAAQMRAVVASGLDMPVYMLYDDVFSEENEDKTVIVDIFPLPEGILSVLEDFRRRAAQFQQAHPNIHLTTCTALAYCPPQFLSKRIQERNQRAEQEGHLENKREGLFPFEQLSTVLKASPQNAPSSTPHSLTKEELLDIVKKHGKIAADSPLRIAEPVDPSLLTEQPQTDGSTQLTHHEGKIKLVVEDELNQSVVTESPLVARDEEIQRYSKLHDSLGYSDYKHAVLSIRHQEAYDVVLDTCKGNASSLAATLVDQVSSLEISRTPHNLP